jgi:hypothetical protein
MTESIYSTPRRTLSLNDRFLLLLSVVLMGYAMAGRGFAYLGFPPIFVGEIAYVLGIATLLRTGCLVAVFATLPGILLAITITYVLARTLPFINMYGTDALRDSVVIVYGGFGLIVVALLLEDTSRVRKILSYYNSFLTVFIPALPLIYVLTYYYQAYVPNLPGTSVPILDINNSEAAAHLAGAAVFALIGFRRATKVWVALLLFAAIMVVAKSRGSLLAITVPIVFAYLVLGKVRQLVRVLIVGTLIFGAAYVGEMTFIGYQEPIEGVDRRPTPSQIGENVIGIIKSKEQGEATKRWRLDWWDLIIRDTLFGDNFWTGRGFGLNLAVADGFKDAESKQLGQPPTRSPHNVHMTILARAGVPGLILWTLLLVSWLGLIMKAMLTARRRRQKHWADLFLFIACYFAAIFITASFDVVLERPMLGIWFWSLFGFGLGSVMIYRYQNGDVLGATASTFGKATRTSLNFSENSHSQRTK